MTTKQQQQPTTTLQHHISLSTPIPDMIEKIFREISLGADADIALHQHYHDFNVDMANLRALARQANDRYMNSCNMLFRIMSDYSKDEDALRVLREITAYVMDRMALTVALISSDNSSLLLNNNPNNKLNSSSTTTTTTTTTQSLEARRKIIQEIADTERAYANSLHALLVYYAQPLQKLINNSDYVLIFAGLTEIAGLADTMSKVFDQQVLARYDDNTSTIGDIFLRFANFLKMYIPYTNSYSKGQELLTKLKESDERINAIASRAVPSSLTITGNEQQQQQQYIDLESLRIKPVQRIPRYVLLLKELEKKTPENHPDSPLVSEALKSIQLVANHVNERMKQSEAEAKALEIQASLWTATGTIPELITPGRRFVKEGPVSKLRRTGTLKRNFYLFAFNDIVVYATKSPILKGRFHFHKAIQFFGAFEADSEALDCGAQLKYGECAFKITGSNGYRIFVVDSDSQRREWLKALNDLSEERDERRRSWQKMIGGKSTNNSDQQQRITSTGSSGYLMGDGDEDDDEDDDD
jgi:hypothetical protein